MKRKRPDSNQRERLLRAVKDGERLYRARMYGGLTLADEHRINGILTLDLRDAVAAFGALEGERDALAEKVRKLEAQFDRRADRRLHRVLLAVFAVGFVGGIVACLWAVILDPNWIHA